MGTPEYLSGAAIELKSSDSFRALSEAEGLPSLGVTKQGTLYKKGATHRLADWLTTKVLQKKGGEEECKKEALKVFIKKVADLPEVKEPKGNQNEKFREEVRDIFFNKISQLRDREFLSDLKKNKIISKELENFLSPALAAKRKKKSQSSSEEKTKTVKEKETEKLARRVERARLAIALGVGAKANKGATGTLLLYSLKGKLIGVHKPTHRHTPLKTRLFDKIKTLSPLGQLHHLSPRDDAQSKAEVAAYLTDQFFGFDLLPSSTMVELGGRAGAFQSAINLKSRATDPKSEAYHEAREHLDELSKRESFDEGELSLFQRFAIEDYLIGNLDCHSENWVVQVIEGKITDLRALDKANSFPMKNPEKAERIKNQYAWKSAKIAEAPYTNKVRTFITEKLKEDEIENYIKHLNEKLPNFLDEGSRGKMATLLRQRAAVLRKAATEKDFSPAKLAELKTTEDINAFLKKT